ncbi:hypothetical protein [Vibrio sp. D431a]|uniref:hypothetical protein n=1 Tax=Vibrio sp. D431a TaxID=2837388 RepID=UPI0025532062|nr:hypothetical protein [Vibrio sp. D431a]MDK9793819.1 hypothetical protein [Vibrio sp. D431a]
MTQVATRTKDTERKYLERAISLCKRALIEAEESGVDTSNHRIRLKFKGKNIECLTVFATAKWGKKVWFPKYDKSTWRQYRSALSYLAEYQFQRGVIHSSNVLDEISEVLKGSNENTKELEKQTSGKKMKSLSDDDLSRLLDELSKSKSSLSGFLSVWLYVNCLVGLRPSEWKTSSIIKGSDDKYRLKVKNAKQTNGRSHGEYRIISLSNFSDNQTEKIIDFTSMCEELNNQNLFDRYYQNCRKLLQRTCKKVWPRRKRSISLYSSRHQFCADLKKSGKKLEEIAYLMGHYSTDTASSHYGKRRYGKSKLMPDVPDAELSKVATKYKKFTFKRTKGQVI